MGYPFLRVVAVLALLTRLTSALTISQYAAEEPKLTLFYDALVAAGLVATLDDPTKSYTVFAPNNNAITTSLPEKYLEPQWRAHLQDILLAHVVEGPPLITADMTVGLTAQPLTGGVITVTSVDPLQINDDIGFREQDVEADNGVVHIIMGLILPPSAEDDIRDIISFIPDFFSTLNSLVIQAGLEETLRQEEITFFAPLDEAWAQMDQEILTGLQTDTEALSQVLLYHAVPGILLGENLTSPDVTVLATFQGNDLPNPVAQVAFGDLLALNGVLHIVDTVFLPPDLVISGDTGGSAPPEGSPPPDGTPTPTSPNGTPPPNGSPPPDGTRPPDSQPPADGTPPPTSPDGQPPEEGPPPTDETPPPTTPDGQSPVDISLPPEETPPPDAPEGSVPPAVVEGGSLVEVALANNITVLVSALNLTGRVDNIAEGGPFTLFAPINSAFSALPQKFLTPAWSSHLENVLSYHVLRGEYYEANLTLGRSLATLSFNNISVTGVAPLQINGVNVIAADVNADNGVMHITEQALLPPSVTDTAIDLLEQFPGEFSTLYSLLNATNLTTTLDGEGPFTIYAPTNDAFSLIPDQLLESLLADTDALSEILLYHVVPDLVEMTKLVNATNVTTVSGSNVTLTLLSAEQPNYKVNDANINFADLLVKNGLVQVIDQVLQPPPPEETEPPLETAVPTSAPTGAPIVETTAPTNQTEALTNQTEAQTNQTEAQTNQTEAQTNQTEAQTNQTEVPTGAPMVTDAPGFDIVDAVLTDPNFSTLAKYLTTTGLVDVLREPGATWTVFAPNNGAFAAIPVDQQGNLTADPDLLASVLLYHVVPDQIIFSSTLTEGQVLTTAEGSSVVVSLNPVMINDATVLTPDIAVSNGVIHVIDTVLIPGEQGTEPVTEMPATDTPESNATTAPGDSIVDAVLADPNFSTLANLLTTTGLVDVLREPGATWTVFAPNNSAFAAIPVDELGNLTADPDLLASVLLYHVVPDQIIFSSNLMEGQVITTAEGSSVVVSLNPVMINDATVLTPDIAVSNGVIHVIDTVLIPGEQGTEPVTEMPATDTPETNATMAPGDSIVDAVLADPNFSTLANLLTTTGLVDVLREPGATWTVFAPKNSAFAAIPVDELGNLTADPDLLASVLLYHVVPDQIIFSSNLTEGQVITTAEGSSVVVSLNPVMINDATVLTPDIAVSNGVIHVIDTVLVPEAQGTEPVTEMPATDTPETNATMAPGDSIVDAVLADPNFSTLADLLTLSGLVDVLTVPGSLWTVFAPNNAAFAAVAPEIIATLTADPQLLTGVLLYHVVPEVIFSFNLTEGQMITTSEGSAVTVSLNPVMINDATVVTPDVSVSNGVIHVIDKVLTPPGTLGTAAVTEMPTTTTDTPATSVPATEPPTAPSLVATQVPADISKCVPIPGQQVCCPPGQTDGVYFFCRYL
jgi:transforming growth factor-beta-induced protein